MTTHLAQAIEDRAAHLNGLGSILSGFPFSAFFFLILFYLLLLPTRDWTVAVLKFHSNCNRMFFGGKWIFRKYELAQAK